MLSRRKFIQQSVCISGGVLATSNYALGSDAGSVQKLIVLHTNDVHSRLEPFPLDGSRNAGLGGVAARAALINTIRSEEEDVLLLDAGDIFQGTPYFNFYKGEPEIKAMSKMRYDAATMGNHDFDAGMENFATQLQYASFPVVLCNYDFTNTPMEHRCVPYKLFKKGKLKIGVTGVGIALKGLVPDALYGNTQYLDPVEHVNRIAASLKKKEGCDMVICLSHLGYRYREGNRMSDEVLAKETEYIDLIIGGHTHTFMDKPVIYKNKLGGDVIVNQAGWGGMVLGRLDFIFEKNKSKSLANTHTVLIGKKSSE
ncbi:metallophosphoesterase [Agriterribacter sp.]|uniref:bifunctional metallophosphatase/5'-nucleotidase n=1 Tax=Agriterribacter sp. TaxID=2821509 RepID=UPI002C46A167|nr:metallophosphoesterase [Agriterribacter sp.]HRO46822.1 metallophosphoesterase [Agriterribacter sp.]HRQ15569.1 metallophosphoesterase [Agriterribacter sp.]